MNYCLQQIRTDTDQYAKPLCCIVAYPDRVVQQRGVYNNTVVLVNTKWIFTQEL